MTRQLRTRLATATSILGIMMLSAALPLLAQGKRSSVGSDIVVAKGTTVDEAACVMCSVYVHGTVTGKVAVVMGDVVVDGTVDDQVAVVMGQLQVQPGGVVNGDVAVAAGSLSNKGTITGRIKQSGGPHSGRHLVFFGILVALLPFFILGLIIWLIVRAVRRPKYPMYPPGPPPPGYPPAPVR